MIDAVCGVALRGNPATDAAVGCLFPGRAVARRVGAVTCCQSGLYAVELALDAAKGESLRILHCNTHVGGSGGFRSRSGKLSDRDHAICQRIQRKMRSSKIEFIHKRDEPRIQKANAVARRCLDSDSPLWRPSEDETQAAISADIVRNVDSKPESPVESDLMRELRKHFSAPAVYEHTERTGWKIPALAGPSGMLVPQLKIGAYRADIAIVNELVQLVVEVDGYEFHDLERDQLERDRQRDRDMMRAGWRVMRFTGREVFHDPAGCAEEIIATLEGLE